MMDRRMDCTLIFPHQLFADHPAITASVRVILVEDSLFFGDSRYPAQFHRHKLLLHRASMQAYADRLRRQGHDVEVIDYEADQRIDSVICQLAADGCKKIRYVNPVDDILEKRIERACEDQSIERDVHPTPMFLTDCDWGKQATGKKPPYRMSSFYAAQRKRLDILMTPDGQPTGGAWSFDVDNRKKWPRGQAVPSHPPAQLTPWIKEARAYVEQRFPNHPGDCSTFRYPVTHEQARTWLDDFIEQRLVGFGTYEDAMVESQTILHHSVLTPMLNIGLLTPQQVVDAVLKAAQRRDIPLNDLEGFIRQVIGWREFMMIMYRRIGVPQRNANFWDHQRPMPESLYKGTTGIVPVDTVIHRVLDGAYCHHIERLMVLGNFMLLCEIEPTAVYRWFMELFIDAYDWVMVPNVYGMSQFADGGWLCTKPYISGSNYIKKMSDYKAGPWCDVWDGLFWRFIHVHKEFFTSQPRLSMMARQLDRMSKDKLDQHVKRADEFLNNDCRMV